MKESKRTMNQNTRKAAMLAMLLAFTFGCTLTSKNNLQPFPAGYIDSAFVVPDGSAIYFLHSVVSTLEILTEDQSAKPVTAHLPGHQAKDGPYWWNSDIYVSLKNPDGTWAQPQNLGPIVNSEHMESSPWTNDEQTMLIFSRWSVTESEFSGTFISRRNSKNEPWGDLEKLPGELGMYEETGFTDFHLVPSENLYFWKDDGKGALYWAKSIGPNQWAPAELLPEAFQSEVRDSQPWVSDDETQICFNRLDDDANSEMLCATRENASAEWGTPTVVQLTGFEDANHLTVWGEPSFTNDGAMFFVRFDTSIKNWKSEILVSVRQSDGSFAIPQSLLFK